ncbi:hypothetical protein [Streptomyces sp. NPDC005438]|uniref:hypothetical protein n=1 Tax=Streptomyces sp. NPDC005438 TaxID=3156880 RepID=UPI0033B96537
MAALESRFYLTADGGGRVETSNHPDRPGVRVWACTSCGDQGEGYEDNGRAHAAGCNTTTISGYLPRNHFR